MAWTEAARQAALEARRLHAKPGKTDLRARPQTVYPWMEKKFQFVAMHGGGFARRDYYASQLKAARSPITKADRGTTHADRRALAYIVAGRMIRG